jgi:hypothetical protein
VRGSVWVPLRVMSDGSLIRLYRKEITSLHGRTPSRDEASDPRERFRREVRLVSLSLSFSLCFSLSLFVSLLDRISIHLSDRLETSASTFPREGVHPCWYLNRDRHRSLEYIRGWYIIVWISVGDRPTIGIARTHSQPVPTGSFPSRS